ncbi:MAG: hypothetical protein ACREQA_16420 [Candidatus Binatia bacterium]
MLALRISIVTITKLLKQLGPLIVATGSVTKAIRDLVSPFRQGGGETRIANLEKAIELQASLNEKVDGQLKIIQPVLENVQRSLKTLSIAVIGIAIIAALAIAIALLK